MLPFPGKRRRAPSAEDWYEQACELEDDAPGEALEAYRRALELDAAHADARVNLGRLLHARGDVAAAEVHYLRALAAAPRHATAWFNLGVALEDRDRPAEALTAYERALANDPTLTDAHFNAALLCERAGRPQDALRHLSACHRARRS